MIFQRKNKEDIVFDSLFWPVMPVGEVGKKLDCNGQSTVIQQYSVPVPQYDQYRRHDQSVYSLWMYFVEFCILLNQRSEPEVEPKNTVSNAFTGLPRLRTFVALSRGESIESELEEEEELKGNNSSIADATTAEPFSPPGFQPDNMVAPERIRARSCSSAFSIESSDSLESSFLDDSLGCALHCTHGEEGSWFTVSENKFGPQEVPVEHRQHAQRVSATASCASVSLCSPSSSRPRTLSATAKPWVALNNHNTAQLTQLYDKMGELDRMVSSPESITRAALFSPVSCNRTNLHLESVDENEDCMIDEELQELKEKILRLEAMKKNKSINMTKSASVDDEVCDESRRYSSIDRGFSTYSSYSCF